MEEQALMKQNHLESLTLLQNELTRKVQSADTAD